MFDNKKITFGVCYYPEHWPESMWTEDIQRMLASGIEVIRVGEFSWNLTEWEDGVFDYTYFDKFLDLTDQLGMRVIFGTPTATPPAWLSEKYPEILNANRQGVAYAHGGRRHYNYNSDVYRCYAARIVDKISKRYSVHPSVIGWQIDNEINCELDEFFSKADDEKFRMYLQNKYETLDALNAAWGTRFWNQSYHSWEHVHLPGNVPNNSENPHQMMDYYRFVSESALSFVDMQSKILRQNIGKDQWITTNGMFDNMDNHKMMRDSLDLYTYDSYPNFAFEMIEDLSDQTRLNDREYSMYLSQVRSICPNYGVMEQQTGANGWTTTMESPMPKPGQISLWTMQSIAHGADFISYFRWRTCTFGTEMYWHGILDYDSRDNRRLREVQDVIRQVNRIEGMKGSRYKADLGILCDYENRWDAKVDQWHHRYEAESTKGLFYAAQKMHIPMDYVYVQEATTVQELLSYKVLIYPHALILPLKTRDLLQSYVEAGGTLVFGARSGQKDTLGHSVQMPLPGLIRDMTGADVVDYTLLNPTRDLQQMRWGEDIFPVKVYNDILVNMEHATSEAVYVNDYYQGMTGVTSKRIGKGIVYYFGTTFGEEAAKVLYQKLGFSSGLNQLLELPESCEFAVRSTDQKTFYFVLNYTKEPQKMTLHKDLLDAITGETVSGDKVLGAYSYLVLTDTAL